MLNRGEEREKVENKGRSITGRVVGQKRGRRRRRGKGRIGKKKRKEEE